MKLFLEGPGAGYTIHSKGIEYISGENIKVESINKDAMTLSGDFKFSIDSITADSYYYRTEELEDIPAVANKLDLNIEYENISAYDDFEDSLKPSAVQKIKEYLYDCYSDDYDSVNDVELSDLYDNYGCNDSLMYDILTVDDFNTNSKSFKFFIEELIEETMEDYADFNYGGGYSHITYDGQVMSISDSDSADMFIDDSTEYGKKVIDYVDRTVTGNTVHTGYDVYIDDRGEYFEDRYEAIDYFTETINNMLENGIIDIDSLIANRTDYCVCETIYHEYFYEDADIVNTTIIKTAEDIVEYDY